MYKGIEFSVEAMTIGFETQKKSVTMKNVQPFSAWCPVKGHIYLDKPAAFNCRFI